MSLLLTVYVIGVGVTAACYGWLTITDDWEPQMGKCAATALGWPLLACGMIGVFLAAVWQLAFPKEAK